MLPDRLLVGPVSSNKWSEKPSSGPHTNGPKWPKIDGYLGYFTLLIGVITTFNNWFLKMLLDRLVNQRLPGDSSPDLFILQLEITNKLRKGQVFTIPKRSQRMAR